MDDLLLFRLLRERRYDAAELGELLATVAGLTPAARAPFLGLLAPLLEEPARPHRAAALRCLAGCEGSEAVQLAQGLLDDEDDEVREAALVFFQTLAIRAPMRWVHVVFHGDLRVRRGALREGAPTGASSMAFALLADEGCRDEVRARFLPGGPGGVERWPLPAQAPAMILEMVSGGLLSQEEGRALLSGLAPSDLSSLVAQGRSREPEVIAAWLKQAAEVTEAPVFEGGGPDDLDQVLGLLWGGSKEEPGTEASRRDFFARLASWEALNDEGVLRRFAASLLRLLVSQGGAPPLVMELLVELHPPVLGFCWLPRGVRRAALRVFYRRGDGTRKQPREVVEGITEGDLSIHEQGGLDLWALGAILQLVQGGPFEALFKWVKVGKVLDAFCERIDESMPFLSLEDRSHVGTAFLLDKLRKRMPDRGAWITALWALTAPLEQLDAMGLKPRVEEEKKETKEERLARKARAKEEPPRAAPEPREPEKIPAAEAVAIFEALLRVEAQGKVIPAKRGERLAQVLAPLVAGDKGGLGGFAAAWLGPGGAEPAALGVAVLVGIAQQLDTDAFVARVTALSAAQLWPLLEAITHCTTMPFAKERALALALVGRTDERVRQWARAKLPAEVRPAAPSMDGKPLTAKQAEDLRRCGEREFLAALRGLGARRTGLTAALGARAAAASVEACVALLGCDDPLVEVDRELARFGKPDEDFLKKLHVAAVEQLAGCATLPTLGHAWLSLWERHAFAFLDLVSGGGKITLEQGLASYLAGFKTPWARSRLLEATGQVAGLLAYRDRPALLRVCTPGLVKLFADELLGPAGYAAAEALVFLERSKAVGEMIASVQPMVQSALPDLPVAVRERLAAWVDSTGLPPPPMVRDAVVTAASVTAEAVRACTDLTQLEHWAKSSTLGIIEEVALRLVDLGEPGLLRGVKLLRDGTMRARLRPLLTLFDLWPAGEALGAARALLDEAIEPEVRFELALAFVRRGDGGAWGAAIDAACAPGQGWFSVDDWERMVELHPDRAGLARGLAASPQPHAYREAVECLLAMKGERPEREAEAGLLAFLAAGTNRQRSLRVGAARWLLPRGAWQALPALIQSRAEGQAEPAGLLEHADRGLVEAVTRSFLLLGTAEPTLVELLTLAPREARGEALERVIDRCTSDETRRAAVRLVGSFPHRAQKIDQIAETFAWGVHRGRELLGGYYKVEMVDGNGLGYTRLNERRVFVSPLPILRRERGGRRLVEALILHELGHHRYHKGEEADRCWKTAHDEHIGGLYNLVLDEHLERNLRAVDEEFGDRLKLLAAYAFQHSNRAVGVAELLRSLGARAAPVLTRCRLGVARNGGLVEVESGAILQGLEREGMAFSRFLRALRMGLGNRHRDGLVDQGLALFKGGFRRRTPEQLLDIARALKRIFGTQCNLLECSGSHESLTNDPSESIANSDAISPQEIDEEVERVLDPKKRKKTEKEELGPTRGRLWINVNPGADFDLITSIVKLDLDRTAADALAARVRRQAFHLRRFLEDLGLARVPERRRVQGQRFDATRATAMVLRGDPRVLIARRLEVRSDVFLGVVVDCSGSMQCGERIERARLFAALIAEAARGLRGIDLRVFGFTDQVIYDAGDAEFCAAHRLEAGGGNNDAAALWHAAQVARRSRRRSRVLVMISDGLPTECSVPALRALVDHLGRREHMVCAQVAVAPITENCFPHHVLLQDDNHDAAVRRFGALIGQLVRSSMTT